MCHIAVTQERHEAMRGGDISTKIVTSGVTIYVVSPLMLDDLPQQIHPSEEIFRSSHKPLARAAAMTRKRRL
jgi:hypothetical protein